MNGGRKHGVRLSVCLDKNWAVPGRFFKSLPVPCGAGLQQMAKQDRIVQHFRTQSLASVISAKRLMVMIVVMGSSAVLAAAQEHSSPFQPASNSERSTSAGRSFAGVPAFLLHCKNLCVLFSPASFFLSFLLPILSTNHNTRSVANKRACDGI